MSNSDVLEGYSEYFSIELPNKIVFLILTKCNTCTFYIIYKLSFSQFYLLIRNKL